MGKATGYIDEDNVLKPVGKIPLKEGEPIRRLLKKKLPFEPIRLKKKPLSKHISSLREDLHDLAMIKERQNEGIITITELRPSLCYHKQQ